MVANVINKMLDRYYKKSEDFIHYDGPPTAQKYFAHEKRRTAHITKIGKMSDILAATEKRLLQMESNPNLSNSQLSRFKAHLRKSVFPVWIDTRGLDPRATKVVVRELGHTHGWKSHQCQGQFDICAGRFARQDPNLTVVTSDSDLMFMGVKELVRFQPKGTRFYSYPIEKMIAHCGLKTAGEWVAAAVISLNDYDPSIGRTSFKTAIEEIKAIKKSWSRKGNADRSVEGYVKEYCKKKKVDVASVKNSIDSFVKLEETPLESFQQGDDELDDSICRIVYRVEALSRR
jgi:hypothetical protein